MKIKCINIQKVGFYLVGFFICCSIQAQYAVSGSILDVNYNYADVKVHLLNKETDQPVSVNGAGQFYTTLDWNKVYHFKFSKPGYVSKIIEFSTKIPENIQQEAIAPYQMSVRLFKEFQGVDTVFFNNPVAKIRFDNRLKDFEADRDYSLNVKYKIEQMRTGVEKDKAASKSASRSSKFKNNRNIKPNEPPTETVKKNEGEIIQPPIKEESQVHLPREVYEVESLKNTYPEGESTEVFELESRVVTRNIFMLDNQRVVMMKVVHNWGKTFYFIDEAPLGYRCISEEMYNYTIDKNRQLISKDK